MIWQIPENEEKERWLQLKAELSMKYSGELELVLPKECDERCFRWFQILEEEDFRFDLRYSRQEIIERLNNPEVLFFFVVSHEIPEILVLGYRLPDFEPPTFYLDTIAIRQRGRGIGDIVLQFVINRARDRTYQAIVLDTEEKDEKGIPLRHFYEEHGFEAITRTEQGDLTMRLDLDNSRVIHENSRDHE
ncbi:MAG: GNAT family N-acetyltransferase [Promethearchaeota archaeon]